ncbi:MAG: hypothetical protein U9N34_04775 [Candidatus Cloacimonadota bacterium]|nr:hypothetical protein [Candidatus Cloacimonadota bacterium]
MKKVKMTTSYFRVTIAGIVVLLGVLTIIASTPKRPIRSVETTKKITYYFKAKYQISLTEVERPEKAGNRYGPKKIYTETSNNKYKFVFEDDMIKILWLIDSNQILFLLQNKTDFSIKIPWDEAAYVDEFGRTHRVMHSGVKYTDRDKVQPPSIIVRKGLIEDLVYPTDYVSWSSGTHLYSGRWETKSLLLTTESYYTYLGGKSSALREFEEAVNQNIGKQIQVLLPLDIEDVTHDYIFTFTVEEVNAYSE